MFAFILKLKFFHGLVILCLSAVFSLHTAPAISEEILDSVIKPDDDIEGELRYLQEETYVITGSRIPQQIEKAAHSVFVVTDKEIQQMGARFLPDVIPIVPGWHVVTNHGRIEMFLVRGAGLSWGSDVLVMVNNHSIFHLHLLTIENAKRIEFVSGAGSASYGSGAMSGVINIITKEADDVDGWDVRVRSGSYDTRQTNILFGKVIKDLEVTANFNYFETNGYDGKVEADEQTALDTMFGTDASLYPGNIKGDADKYENQLTLAYKGLKLQGRYYNYEYELPLSGYRNLLDEESEHEWETFGLTFVYDVDLWEGFNLLTTLYRANIDYRLLLQMYPEDSFIGTPTGPTILSESLFQKWTGNITVTGFETQATYDITDANTFVVGFTYSYFKTDENFEGNYTPTGNPTVVIPLSSFQDWPDEYNWDSPYKSDFKAVFLEDVWDIQRNLRINLGIRYDEYSDFGDKVSPRAGLNWQFVENYFLKLNYGRAFRAPSFVELHHPTIGNDDLDPETEDTYELGVGARFLPAFTGQVTYFYRETKDSIITPVDGVSYNTDKDINRGVEIQIKYDFGRGSYLSMNYTHIDPDFESYVQPERMGTVVANIRLNQYLNINTHCLYRGDWHRREDDPRDDMDDYVVVNTKLTVRQFLPGFDGLEFGLSVFNVFDEDYSEQSVNVGLPGDFPMPGRNYMFELRYVY